MRNNTSDRETRSRNSDRKYSAMNRSVPVTLDAAARWGPPAFICQRGEVKAGGPALGLRDEPINVRRCEVDARAREERRRFTGVHREIVSPDFDDASLSAKAWDGYGHRPPRTDRQLRAGGKPERQLGDHVVALRIGQRLRMIEHQEDGLGHPGDGRDQPNDVRHAHSRSRDRPEDSWLEALDPIERDREICEEDGRVVVTFVDRHPRHTGRLQICELRKQCALAVPGWRHYGDQWGRIL